MKNYIWGERNGIYIIDLTQTVQMLESAYNVAKEFAAVARKSSLWGPSAKLSTLLLKKQIVAGAYYINRRWLGGTLTNF